VGGDIVDRIAAGIEDEEERKQFLRATGRVTEGEAAYAEIESAIMGMGGAERLSATRRLVDLASAPGFSLQGQTPESLMAALGYYRTEGGTGGEAYTIKAGETVSELAARFDVSQSTIMRRMGITDPSQLRTGATLTTGPDEWQRLPLYMTGGYGGVKMAEEEEARGPADDVQEAIDKIAEMREALDEAMTTPRTVPVMLQFAADLEAMNPVLRPMVERILADLLRNRSVGTTGGAATMRTTASGMRVR
jgi:LysM repeat protein